MRPNSRWGRSQRRSIHVHLQGDRLPTCRHTAMVLCCQWLHQRGEKHKTKQKNKPMTLKSFYSHNHRLPSPWIRAVTPAPACLPPWLPKLPAGRQMGRLPSYCQGGQGRGKTGWERFNITYTHTLRASIREGETERERNIDTSHQRQT